jgi:phospholipid/cholesterol/gamma-HCH transport system permease protein
MKSPIEMLAKPVASAWERLRAASETTYDIAALIVRSLRGTGYAIRRTGLLTKQMYAVGNSSLLIVTLFGLFVGLILVRYGAEQLPELGLQKQIGLAGLPIIWEFGPVFTAFILAGRVGSAYAAEIGTMRVYDEIDSLVVMGVRPEAYLVAPRLLACVVLVPCLVIYADFAALIGGAFMAWVQLHVPPSTFFEVLFNALPFSALWRSLLKAAVFGGIIAITGCYKGFRTAGGAEGVGRSTTESVVHSLLAILIADYFLSKLLMPEWQIG